MDCRRILFSLFLLFLWSPFAAHAQTLKGSTTPEATTTKTGTTETTGTTTKKAATYCGDGTKQKPNDDGFFEECDGNDGVGPHQKCNAKCQLLDLTYCGDSKLQSPNGEGVLEECDGAAGVGAHQKCSSDCKLLRLTYCGDKIVQSPNGEGLMEECDTEAGVGAHQQCTSTCGLIDLTYCGDGTMQSPNNDVVAEECDDANNVNTDRCASCKKAFCGDGILRGADIADGLVIGPGEVCDNGAANNDQKPGACKTDCSGLVPQPICGDGVVNQAVEQCDDGNAVNTDACRNNCVAARCGDSIIDAGETCDNGSNNSSEIPGACSTDCAGFLPKCGDGLRNQDAEQCDDGNQNNLDACRNDCVAARCGDGIVDAGETCDNGASNSDDVPGACSNDCIGYVPIPECGDGVVNQTTEACDDGNANNLDACRNNCTLPFCGDGIPDSNETCDQGNLNSEEVPGACSTDCAGFLPKCGDGEINQADEQCDDGNAVNADACRNSCLLPICGDSIIDAGETCDNGAANNDDVPGACRNDCIGFVPFPECGDGVVNQANEECDDGNADEFDACHANCTFTRCGDGRLQQPNGFGFVEACEGDNGLAAHQSCSESCTIKNLTYCGDGVIHSPNDEGVAEECDGQAGVGVHQLCGADCKRQQLSTCGDGVKQSPNDEGVNEACDGADGVGEHQACSNDCQLTQLPFCGDGMVNGAEQCDGAAGVGAHQNCSESCVIRNLTFCGDGALQNPNDEGVAEACDGNAGVVVHHFCDAQCRQIPLTYCGDGILQTPNGEGVAEACDGAAGVAAHQSCSESCILRNLTFCGDGVKQTPNEEGVAEVCDGADGVGEHQACSSECRLVDLEFCGDGVVNGTEQCDGAAGVGAHQSCSESCTIRNLTFCGDNLVQPRNDEGAAEACDGQAGIEQHQRCSADCRVEALTYCSDGRRQTPNQEGFAEECDGADGVGAHQECSNQCRLITLPFCGDGQTDDGEQCDDGNANNNDACRNNCAAAACGDGIVDIAEACDEAAANGQPGHCNITCNGAVPLCGNGLLEAGESCDGAAGIGAHQRCSNGCQLQGLTFCGDGVLQTPNEEGVREQCDGRDGVGEHQLCDLAQCLRVDLPYCGDGETTAGEECDDANLLATDNCVECKLARCGDGIVKGPDIADGLVLRRGEACDNGAVNNDQVIGACKTDCTGFVPPPLPPPVQKKEPPPPPPPLVQKKEPPPPPVAVKKEPPPVAVKKVEEKKVKLYPTAECRSEIFDCDLTCSIASPFKEVTAAAVLNPGNYENQFLVFAGSSDGAKGIAFKASAKMLPTCGFAFESCSIDGKPWIHMASASLNPNESDDLVGATAENYFYLMDAEKVLKEQKPQACALAPTPLLSTLGRERQWEEKKRSVVGTIQKIHQLSAFSAGEGRKNVVGAVEVQKNQPKSPKYIGLDLFFTKKVPGKEMVDHVYVPVTGYPSIQEIESVEILSPLTVWVTTKEDGETFTDTFECADDEGWHCRPTLQRKKKTRGAKGRLQPEALNVMVPEEAGLRGYKISEDEEDEPEELENEELSADAPLNKIKNDAKHRYLNTKLPLIVKRNDFGGDDLAAFYDAIDTATDTKQDTIVSIYHNRNESPEIVLKANPPEEMLVTIEVSPSDVMDDPLECSASLTDAKGSDMSHLILHADCSAVIVNTVAVAAEEESVRVEEAPAVEGGKAAKSSENVVEEEGVGEGEILEADVSWPLVGEICTVDPGDAAACAGFSVAKSGEASIAPTSTGGSSGTAAAPEEGAEAPRDTYKIAGGGCLGSIAGENSDKNPLMEFGSILLVLLGLLASRFRIYFQNLRGRRDSNPRSSP